jgi:hypothetical protein
MKLRQLALAACGLVASAGLACAQSGPWSPTPLGPPAFQHPHKSVSPVAQVGCANCGAATAAAVPSAGCSSCGSGAASSGLAARFANSPLTIGQGCASGPYCGSFASERTFLFGSCRQFFNAGDKCGGGCGGLYGPGGFGDTSACKYGSYLNR